MFFHVRMHDYPVPRRTPEVRTRHRQYLEQQAGHLIARGATQSDDGTSIRGSIFFVEFPDRAALDRFLADEPFTQAGVYMGTEVFRWNNALNRAAGQYTGKEGQALWYLRGYARPGMDDRRRALFDQHGAYLEAREEQIVVRGGVFADDGESWLGSAMVVALPERAAADAFAASEPFCANGLFERISIERCALAGPGHR